MVIFLHCLLLIELLNLFVVEFSENIQKYKAVNHIITYRMKNITFSSFFGDAFVKTCFIGGLFAIEATTGSEKKRIFKNNT